MKRSGLVAALDLGSTKTCAVIAEAGSGSEAKVRILGVGLAKTSGVRRGVVRNIEETTQSVVRALTIAERIAGVKVPSVFCGIAGEHLRTQVSSGLASVSGDEIRRGDMERANESARAVTLGDGFELLHYIPQEYKVDHQSGISDPIGMTGMRLDVEMCLVAVQSQAAQNLRRSVQRAGYQVNELVLEPLAASLGVLTDEEKELGCALVELGGGSTNVAVFQEGKLRHLASLPYASSHVTSDLVQGLGVTHSDAEFLKEKYGVAYTALVDEDERVELPGTPGQGPRQARRELLSHIIQARLDEIFELVHEQIEISGYMGRLPAGIVLTGGGAQLQGVVELGREVFAMPIRLGTPGQGISGLVDNVQSPRYAVPVGLILYGTQRRGQGDGHGLGGRIFGPIKQWLQDEFF